ncbi:MAG TPA: ABC transporter permease [Afifellaceae bacterium]|nr:ABC transporter permease [Afifellaceae bacterium]
MSRRFSVARTVAVLMKELIQMRRDRLTFAMMVGIPIVQLVLFGFAINTDPKSLPTAAIVADHGPHVRAIVAGMRNSGYFNFIGAAGSEADARAMLARGDVAFVITVPPGFTHDLLRGDRPQLLLEADATDPAAASNAVGAFERIVASALRHDLIGPSGALAAEPPAVETVLHRLYNPEGITQYNIVPGLLGVVLTLSTVLMTALALTREYERGTMENLLAMPARPAEIMVGKVVPYIGLGFVQVTVILIAARLLFDIPLIGSLWLLLAVLLVFIAANVTLGYTFSTLAHTQMQAMQMTFFFFLPSILLSGFMFPFRGMPDWAQWIGEALPLTHFNRIVRGIVLKGNDLPAILPDIWPIGAFFLAVATLALVRYRRTLD